MKNLKLINIPRLKSHFGHKNAITFQVLLNKEKFAFLRNYFAPIFANEICAQNRKSDLRLGGLTMIHIRYTYSSCCNEWFYGLFHCFLLIDFGQSLFILPRYSSQRHNLLYMRHFLLWHLLRNSFVSFLVCLLFMQICMFVENSGGVCL